MDLSDKERVFLEMNYSAAMITQSARADPNVLMWSGQPKALDEFLEVMRAEHRLIYEFEPVRTYGLSWSCSNSVASNVSSMVQAVAHGIGNPYVAIGRVDRSDQCLEPT